MINQLKRLFSNEDGATMVEYGIMVALIAVVCIAIVQGIGGNLNNKFTAVNTAIQ